MIRLCFLLLIILAVSADKAWSQAKASVYASVTIVEPASIKVNDINSPYFSIASKAKAVEINSVKVQKTIKVFNIHDSTTMPFASFSIPGSPFAYAITLSTKAIIADNKVGNDSIQIASININELPPVCAKESSKSFIISSTIHSRTFHTTGSYIPRGAFAVTVNYN
jgi:hypothetical protein